MRAILMAVLAAVLVSLFGSAAIQAAGDSWPDGGSLPPQVWVAGDSWPDGG